jgi:predicted RNA binding protein YcfA (HicA-like mRNA interferase family)
MGSKYPILIPDEIIRTLSKLGFHKVSQKGSHAKYKNDTSPVRTVIIPIHSEIARGTLKSILDQAGITLEEFLDLL